MLFYFDGRRVVAADLITGARKWAVQITDKFGSERAWSMVLSGNTLVVNELTGCDSASDPDSTLVAFNARTGAELWSQFVAPVVGGMVVSGTTLVYDASDFAANVVQARNVSNGALLWSDNDCLGPFQRFVDTPGSKATGAFVVGTTVTAICGQNLDPTGLNLATGAPKWTKPGATFFRGTVRRSPTHRFTSVRPGRRDTSKPLQRPAPSSGHRRVRLARCWLPVPHASTSAHWGALCALNRTTGARVWKDATDHPTGAILADDVVYPVPGDSPRNADTGAAIATTSLDIGQLLGGAQSAQVSNGHLIVETGRIMDVYSLN